MNCWILWNLKLPLQRNCLNILSQEKNKEGKIEIISDKPTTQQLYLRGAIGYNNGVNLLNDACKAMYSKKGVGTARSLNIEDIEKHFTEEGKHCNK